MIFAFCKGPALIYTVAKGPCGRGFWGFSMNVDIYQSEMYLKLLDKLGPEKFLTLLEKLMVDLKNTKRGLKAAQAARSKSMLLDPSHILISLAGALSITDLCKIAQDINKQVAVEKIPYPAELVQSAILEIDQCLMFLKADKIAREQAL